MTVSGAILLVSRSGVVGRRVQRDLELEQGKLTTYPGNFTDFLRLRQLKYERPYSMKRTLENETLAAGYQDASFQSFH